eukprot:3648688-Pleurochrysis_carterae.AAC.1
MCVRFFRGKSIQLRRPRIGVAADPDRRAAHRVSYNLVGSRLNLADAGQDGAIAEEERPATVAGDSAFPLPSEHCDKHGFHIEHP